MACQKAVIYSDFPAIMEATGNIGISFIRGSAAELVAGIEKLFYDDSLRKTMAKKGREYVCKSYNREQVFKKYEKIFLSLL